MFTIEQIEKIEKIASEKQNLCISAICEKLTHLEKLRVLIKDHFKSDFRDSYIVWHEISGKYLLKYYKNVYKYIPILKHNICPTDIKRIIYWDLGTYDEEYNLEWIHIDELDEAIEFFEKHILEELQIESI